LIPTDEGDGDPKTLLIKNDPPFDLAALQGGLEHECRLKKCPLMVELLPSRTQGAWERAKIVSCPTIIVAYHPEKRPVNPKSG
jgi:hypothetical protein